MPSVQSRYLHALHAAMRRPPRGDAASALPAFLSLNAGYFLGEWLPEETHRRLVERLAGRLDGLAGIDLPADQTIALQLAQHARELAAAFGPTPWTEQVIAITTRFIPAHQPDLGEPIATALRAVAAGGNGDPLLRLHAQRRLWTLTHPDDAAGQPQPPPAWALTLALDAAASANGRAIQVAEAALAELIYGG